MTEILLTELLNFGSNHGEIRKKAPSQPPSYLDPCNKDTFFLSVSCSPIQDVSVKKPNSFGMGYD